ncbi:ABC transporter substrate-binding protein [Rhodoferax sp. PAMC 29310]|uniref:ABC transporter substrate-binding protein n=1 Tax=Rhodoferax sp. PAMC 29310 TaxID=2822760 RepID=UPI001B324BF0|nr:ABC transporter substrate-binding protein [Rhodoferax sp. PAMC 29310]
MSRFRSPSRALASLALAGSLTLSLPAMAQLRIGQPSGFTGTISAGVIENTAGANLYFDAVNAKGGVFGQKVELVSVDDKFDPKLTVELARKLITEDRVLALFLNRGTPHAQALMPLLAEFKVPLVAPSTGAMLLHDPVNPWIFNVRATYQREASEAIEHLARVGITRTAVLTTDDTFGADGAAGTQTGFAKVKQQPVLVEKFPREKPDFSDIIPKVVAANAQAVVIIGSAGNVANAVAALRYAKSSAQVVTLSNNASEGFIKLLGANARGVIVTQVFPYERSIKIAMIREARDLAKAKGLDGVTPAMLEGFAGAKVLVEGLRRAGPQPTRQSLRDALEGMDNYNLGGISVSYNASNHTGLDFADISIINADGKFLR